MIRETTLATFVCTLILGLSACEKQGPVERAGEEVDEAVDTIKHGGDESLGNKVDDAVDDARNDAKDVAEETKPD